MNEGTVAKFNSANRIPGGLSDIWETVPGEGPCSAIVMGGGFGGMGAALRLRALGYRVLLIERAPRLGGRAQVFERDGFRHDAGPTVITAPFLFDELFGLFGKSFADYVKLVPLDPWYRFRYHDGTTFDYAGTMDGLLANIRAIEPRDVEGYQRMLARSKLLYDTGFTKLAAEPFHDTFKMLGLSGTLLKLEAYRTFTSYVHKYLKNPKLRQAFSIQPMLLGGSPFDTTCIYGLIHYLEQEFGVYFAMGGTGAIVDAFAKLMAEQGVGVWLNTTVARVEVEGRKAKGVVLEDGRRIPADVVVSNVDPFHLYESMVPPQTRSFAVRAKQTHRKSIGLYVLYFGTRKTYPDVAHHTIWFGPRFKEHLNELFSKPAVAEDFSLYIHRPTATDQSFAPPGCESFYVLCPVPSLKPSINWEIEGPKLRDRIIEALDATTLPGLKHSITSVFDMTPADFRDRYLSADGAGFSAAPLLRQSAFFRFHNRAERIDGLYLVGAGTHPGAGIPGVLSSAKTIDKLVPAVKGAAARGAS
jgi:phytoene desaturase